MRPYHSLKRHIIIDFNSHAIDCKTLLGNSVSIPLTEFCIRNLQNLPNLIQKSVSKY